MRRRCHWVPHPPQDTSPSLGIPTRRGQRKRPQFLKGDEGSKRMLGVPGLSENEGQRAIYQPA